MNNIDKIKIFDHFSKKAKITTYEVFRRSNDHKLFGVNVIINGIEWCLEHNSLLADFRCKNDISFGYHAYSAKYFPRIFKEAIIDTCIKMNESILAQTSISHVKSSTIVFIPQASSLEELAIEADLAS